VSQTKAQLLNGKSATVEFSAGTASLPAVTFTGDTNTGIYSPGADQVAVATGGTGRLFIDSSGRVGIGTTSLSERLHVNGNIQIDWGTNRVATVFDNSFRQGMAFDSSNRQLRLFSTTSDSGGSIGFYTRNAIGASDTDYGTERARIDSSGRLLIGTSSTSQASRAIFQGNSFSASGGCILKLSRGDASPNDGGDLGNIEFTDSNHQFAASISAKRDGGTWTSGSSQPTRLTFSVSQDGQASPSERYRISNAGNGRWFASSGDAFIFGTGNAASSSDRLLVGVHTATMSSGTTCFQVNSNGNVLNTNGSYTTISDVKLKENIVDASSQWNDLKAIQIRNWNFKAETGHETRRQIGPIAQELETVCPGLVFETPDRDEDGNETGEVTKGVNQSVLYMKAVKALQEAMERIEQLEAKVAALESA